MFMVRVELAAELGWVKTKTERPQKEERSSGHQQRCSSFSCRNDVELIGLHHGLYHNAMGVCFDLSGISAEACHGIMSCELRRVSPTCCDPESYQAQQASIRPGRGWGYGIR